VALCGLVGYHTNSGHGRGQGIAVVRGHLSKRQWPVRLAGRIHPVEELPASFFLGPVQSFGEFTPRHGVNKRFELVLGQVPAEPLQPVRHFGPNSDSFFGELRVLQERFHRFLRRSHTGWMKEIGWLLWAQMPRDLDIQLLEARRIRDRKNTVSDRPTVLLTISNRGARI
jgi:hypothetical protein